MANVSVSIGVAVLTFGVGLLGLYLKRLVPERHMSAGSRDMIGAVVGLLSLLLALVLGTLVGSAYGFFATQKSDIESLCARSLELDLAFRQYGPETQPLRQALRDSMQEALDFRGDSAAYLHTISNLAATCPSSRSGTRHGSRQRSLARQRK